MLKPETVFMVLTTWACSILAVPKDCPPEKHWVESHARRAFYRADGTFVGASQVDGHCRKNPKGYSSWNARINNNRPRVWHYTTERSRKWTSEEVERVLEALGEIPDVLRSQSVDGVYRMDNSQEAENPATTNFGDTVLYDIAFDQKYTLAFILAHEQAHRFYDKLSEEQKGGFERAGKWIRRRVGRKVRTLPGRPAKEFINLDGMRSPEEDFANGIEVYVFKPMKLKQISPGVYEWIDKNFGAKLGEGK